ncbi:sugar phosphate nucleotidyltransferase [Paenibacillus sp. GD4]|jgi:mannose-1-phosphate guanylyltransferase|uniref:sugar phosphate nucleotidyltransferase n=1 Tax=Paenibacillus sp. GD4 TaxID=3068890 RepID=UPI0027964308|nr:sugar phosphate nucleotidyltransferase [Paenibacillus sp. GD4]MDQ1910388.1 sugar phosphate nucleotidyltransferase [Paenibacillus sp. GD4]
MKLVLLSGGSGKRLWPLSNDMRSKQFLKVLRGKHGRLESMVQRVWGQLSDAGLARDAYIATGRGQADMLQSQIGSEVPVIIEPDRRDTFPAIALAATYLYSMEGVSLNEVITILPVDPYVEDSFFEKMKDLEQIIRDTGAEVALMGVRPTCPSEKYGYIVPEEGAVRDAAWKRVSHFAEKPCEEKAEELIGQQALWNCGVFAFKLDYLINLLIAKGLPIQYEAMAKVYDSLPSISFDYEVLEKAKRLVVTSYEGCWKDLGTWNTLTEEVQVDVIGKGTISPDSHGTHVINELDIPVAVLGVSNVIVSVSPDGILVSDKHASPRVKELIKNLDQRPMYEERRWGSYRVLDYKRFPDGQEVLTKRIVISAGRNLSYQLHEKRSEVWTVISGYGQVVLNERIHPVRAGDVLKIPVGTRHSIRATEDLEIIEVQSGSELTEEDIVRLSSSWDEIILMLP